MLENHKLFLDKIFNNMKNVGFEDAEFKEIDHVAYRTETDERYEELKREFQPFVSGSDEVMIAGRLISVFKLKEPVVYGSWIIYGLELCAPKENSRYKEGLEHAEFVTKCSLEEFMKKHQDIKFDMKAFEKEVNRELVFDFSDCTVKFHEQSLLELRNS